MAIMPGILMSSAEDMCPRGSVCQASPNMSPDPNSDLDNDDNTTSNSTWAGIAVVIVVVLVSAGVWYALRRRRRARGGHDSVDVGEEGSRFALGQRFGAFWQGRFARKGPQRATSAAGELELVQGEEPKDNRRSSSTSNLKRTTTSGTVGTDASHGAKLNAQLKAEESVVQADVMAPPNHSHRRSSETIVRPGCSMGLEYLRANQYIRYLS